MTQKEALAAVGPGEEAFGSTASQSLVGGLVSSICRRTNDFLQSTSLAQSLHKTLGELFFQEVGYQSPHRTDDTAVDVDTIIDEAIEVASARTATKPPTLTWEALACTLTRLQQLDISDEELDQVEETLNTLFADSTPGLDLDFTGRRRGRTRLVTLKPEDLPSLLKMIAYDRAEQISQLSARERATVSRVLEVLCSSETPVKATSPERPRGSQGPVDIESQSDQSDGQSP